MSVELPEELAAATVMEPDEMIEVSRRRLEEWCRFTAKLKAKISENPILDVIDSWVWCRRCWGLYPSDDMMRPETCKHCFMEGRRRAEEKLKNDDGSPEYMFGLPIEWADEDMISGSEQ